MTDFPDLKIKALVSFPATILDGSGIDVVKQNGNYQFNLAFDDFAPPVSAVSDPVNQNALLWNSVTNQYALTPVSAMLSTITAATALPLINATPALVGGSAKYAREDHVHPTDTSRVAKAGDTMTGDLTISKANPALVLNKTAAGQNAGVYGYINNLTRWFMALGDAAAESGSNVGSDFSIYRYSDAGAFLDNPLTIKRSTGNATFAGQLVGNNNVWAGAGGSAGTYQFGNTGTKSLSYDGTNFSLSGGGLYSVGQVATQAYFIAGSTGTSGTYYFGNTGTKYLQYDGTNFNLLGGQLLLNHPSMVVGNGGAIGTVYFGNTGTKYLNCDGTNFSFSSGNMSISGSLNVASDIYAYRSANQGVVFLGSNGSHFIQFDGANYYLPNAPVQLGTGMMCKGGQGGAYGNDVFNSFWTGSALQAWVNTSNLGNFTISSDYRIKKDVIDLPGMWDIVKALRPIKYTHADFTLPVETEARRKAITERKQQIADGMIKPEDAEQLPPLADPNAPFFRGDDIEHWGFIAHELQDTLTLTAATGHKDSPDHIQSPNPFTVIAALTKALQEAMGRIEALEKVR